MQVHPVVGESIAPAEPAETVESASAEAETTTAPVETPSTAANDGVINELQAQLADKDAVIKSLQDQLSTLTVQEVYLYDLIDG
jgi:uncharacterized coiled-coil protein SlyX